MTAAHALAALVTSHPGATSICECGDIFGRCSIPSALDALALHLDAMTLEAA